MGAEIGGWVGAEGEEEPAEYGVGFAQAHFEEVGEGVETEVVGGAVTGVLDEVRGVGVDDAGFCKGFGAVEGCSGEDVVV